MPQKQNNVFGSCCDDFNFSPLDHGVFFWLLFASTSLLSKTLGGNNGLDFHGSFDPELPSKRSNILLMLEIRRNSPVEGLVVESSHYLRRVLCIPTVLGNGISEPSTVVLNTVFFFLKYTEVIRVKLGIGEIFFVREHELEEEENADKLLSST